MIKNISVIGAGTMGHGMAHVFARHGYKVSLYDSFPEAISAAPGKIRNELEFLVEEDIMPQEDIEKTLQNIEYFTDLAEAVKEADYVIEAIPEKLELKKDLFAQLDSLCPKDTIFASNTSSLKLFDMIEELPKERQALCMISHWYNPPYLIPVAELSKFGNMSEENFNQVYDVYIRSEKKPVCVLKDIPGMIANRILHALSREVFHLIEIGAASMEDVNTAMMYGPCFRSATTGMPEIADMGGLDVWLTVQDSLFGELDNSDKACDTMRNLVAEGRLGLKNGKGYFDYTEEEGSKMQENFNRRLAIQLKASQNYDKLK